MRANARRLRSHAPREDGDAHLVGAHPAVRAAVPEVLPVDAHDASAAIATDHRADVADAAACHRGIAATEDPGGDQLLAVEKVECPRPALLEVLPHQRRMV